MKTAIKVLIFVALMCIYWAFGGLDDSKQFRRLHITITAVFTVGAVIALWQGDEIGVLHPVSLRPIFVILGSLMMIGAFAAMIVTRGERENRDGAPNKSLQPTPAAPS